MAILASTILADAAKLLQDDTNVAWPLAELLTYLNAGRREVVLGKPEAFVKNVNHQLLPGTKQEIPADGNVFIRLTRNMGLAGTAPGRAILPIPIQVLDEQNPNWHGATANAVALHVAFDERDNKRFYVYPPQPTPAAFAEIVYSATPPDITSTQDIGISDLFQSALLDYVLYRAYSKDSEYTRNDAKAASYYQQFVSLLIGKTAGENKNDASNSAIGNQRAGKKAG